VKRKVSAAERQRQYRALRNADPERWAENLEKDRERWNKKRNAGLTRTVANLSEREQRHTRTYWREAQQRCRARGQRTFETPPPSPEPDPEPHTTSKECMYDECPKCRSKVYHLNHDNDAEGPVRCVQWTSELGERRKKNKENQKESQKESQPVRMTVKKEMESSLGDMFDMFQKQLRVFTRHHFNIKTQYDHFRELKKSMTSHECLIHIHFSENYAFKLSAEIRAVHFASSQQQTTLHTGILHVGGVDKHLCFTTISASKEKSHGKGAPDGVGGVLKRTADRLVSEGKDIPNPKRLYDSLLSVQTSIQLFYIEEEAVNKAGQKMPKQLPVVPSTMRLQQTITQAPGKIIYSCQLCLLNETDS
ncbi:unnamed protein product, partial [Menidia menidia]